MIEPSLDRRCGRPRRADSRRVKVGFKASDEERRRLSALAKTNGQTVSDFIREAVMEAASDCTDDPVFRQSGVVSVSPQY